MQQGQRNFSSRLYTSEAAEAWRSIRDSFSSIIVDVEDETGIATVTINRPESLNALNTKVRNN
jgi:1,4-dihydroxy-2-naphthoyl-CoA synthase